MLFVLQIYRRRCRTPTLCHFLMTSFVTTGLGLHAAAQRVRLETQILNTQIWKRVTNDAGSVRELAPRISGANVRNNQHWTADSTGSLLLSMSEGRRKQKSAVTCFMFHEGPALPSFSDMQHKGHPPRRPAKIALGSPAAAEAEEVSAS